MQEALWYATLIKPAWAPPAWVFSPVWTVLYALIILSFGFVAYKIWKREIPRAIALPFGINILANLAFSPIQFGIQNNLLASIDILIVLASLVWALYVICPHYRWVAFVNIPYLAWVSFASVLQLTITYLNWP